MRRIETTATVGPDGTLTMRVPRDVPPGEHRVVVVIETGAERAPGRREFSFPIHDVGPWPEGLSLRREDMYGDWGR